VKRLIKFLHTIGAIGLMGATASLLALIRHTHWIMYLTRGNLSLTHRSDGSGRG
jgi:hypothetical protein